ncbi:Hypothetical predicted protein [Paramuricea clavata]|uniref:Uncharacterized protein n=1 Tax=Paramuricea clavata TaxID=317549 RepID=A0A6S7IZL0_PARCT|nr:Hypothetical predicted protein [Paramuricea clavata]
MQSYGPIRENQRKIPESDATDYCGGTGRFESKEFDRGPPLVLPIFLGNLTQTKNLKGPEELPSHLNLLDCRYSLRSQLHSGMEFITMADSSIKENVYYKIKMSVKTRSAGLVGDSFAEFARNMDDYLKNSSVFKETIAGAVVVAVGEIVKPLHTEIASLKDEVTHLKAKLQM